MIRREELAHLDPVNGRGFRELRAAVKRGESVRITGLGTLLRYDLGGPGEPRFRLTLTAAVAKAWPPRVFDKSENLYPLEIDVRHLARALGAPVEVWAPATINDTRVWQRITTVQP